ncbi:MAG: cytochrome b/b6 domain-containing protein [Carboxydocellales bacterium]
MTNLHPPDMRTGQHTSAKPTSQHTVKLTRNLTVKRHCWSNRFTHWAIALSTIVLFVSGFGQMPMYARYGFTKIPGFSWSGNYQITLNLHYAAAVALIFAVTYHLTVSILRKEFNLIPRRGDLQESWQIIKAMLGFGQEPESDKYLAEQRVAYLYIGLNVIVLLATGAVKVLKNTDLYQPGTNLIFWINNIHIAATFTLLFGIFGHLLAFSFKANRKLLPGIITGRVCCDYVKHRHSKWYCTLDLPENIGRPAAVQSEAGVVIGK